MIWQALISFFMGPVIDTPNTLVEGLRTLCQLLGMELQFDALIALVGILFATGATLAWTRFLHPKK